ncbi:hypothetical protein I4U23_012268 [Adineta vaga]|nr:hypothetical protein I4U23_012268 [Adineta vaga]
MGSSTFDTTDMFTDSYRQTIIRWINIRSIHSSRDLWGAEDPNLFIPERHPLAFLAFVVGPRAGIRIRFALMETKICSIHLLENYTILSGEHLEEGFQIKDRFTVKPKAINIKLLKRF